MHVVHTTSYQNSEHTIYLMASKPIIIILCKNLFFFSVKLATLQQFSSAKPEQYSRITALKCTFLIARSQLSSCH